MVKAVAKKVVSKKPEAKANGKATKKAVSKTTASKHRKKLAAELSDLDVIYPERKVLLYLDGTNLGELTEEQAKDLIGWQELEDDVTDYDLVDYADKKVRLCNNYIGERLFNRRFDMKLANTWANEILNNRWKDNGESMIIGKTGRLVSCQHRLAGLVLACQEWRENKTEWPEWKSAPTIPCMISFGTEEDDETVNTTDTGQPRSLMQIIGRSMYLADYPKGEKETVARYVDFALRLLHKRTGAGRDSFSTNHARKRAQGDFLNYLERHESLMKFVRHIHEENNSGDGNSIGSVLSPGYAAALCYLMASSGSSKEKYHGMMLPDESKLNWDNEEKATEFWTEVAFGSNSVAKPIRELQKEYAEQELWYHGTGLALICKAWALFVAGKKITTDKIALNFSEPDDDGARSLIESPIVGGIDFGDDVEDESTTHSDDDDTPEEIEAAKKKIQRERQAKKANGDVEWKVNDPAYVVSETEGGDWYKGLVVEFTVLRGEKHAKIKCLEPEQYKGKQYVEKMTQLRKKQPQD